MPVLEEEVEAGYAELELALKEGTASSTRALGALVQEPRFGGFYMGHAALCPACPPMALASHGFSQPPRQSRVRAEVQPSQLPGSRHPSSPPTGPGSEEAWVACWPLQSFDPALLLSAWLCIRARNRLRQEPPGQREGHRAASRGTPPAPVGFLIHEIGLADPPNPPTPWHMARVK